MKSTDPSIARATTPSFEGDYDPSEAREDFIRRVKEEGYDVRTPASNELFIDIDNTDQWDRFNDLFRRLKGLVPDVKMGRPTPSKSGWPKRHVVVTMPFDMNDWQRVAYQAALGSDPVRELLTCVRVQHEIVHPVIFIEAKPEPPKCSHGILIGEWCSACEFSSPRCAVEKVVGAQVVATASHSN